VVKAGLTLVLDICLELLGDQHPENDVAVVPILGAFAAVVDALRGRGIADGDADVLIAAAEEIIALLEPDPAP